MLSFLHNRRLGVVLNGQSSSWLSIRAGVLQGSVLGSQFFFYLHKRSTRSTKLWPLFFLIYINDLQEELNSEVKLFTDGTS